MDVEEFENFFINCPQCGDDVDALYEGYCEKCCNENQEALDRHNHEYDYWARLDEERRNQLIREAST